MSTNDPSMLSASPSVSGIVSPGLSVTSGGGQAERSPDVSRAEGEPGRPAAAQAEDRARSLDRHYTDANSGFNQFHRSHSRHVGRRWGG
jgi:hypothetical protein